MKKEITVVCENCKKQQIIIYDYKELLGYNAIRFCSKECCEKIRTFRTPAQKEESERKRHCTLESRTEEEKFLDSKRKSIIQLSWSKEKKEAKTKKELETKAKKSKEEKELTSKRKSDGQKNRSEEEKKLTSKRKSDGLLNRSKEKKEDHSKKLKKAIKQRSSEREKERIRKQLETKSKRTPEQEQERLEKAYNTFKTNNSFNKSKPAEEDYLKIKELYPNAEFEYKDKIRYPFACDAYIPELDLFIELHYGWRHETEPFDKTNKKHISIVLDWFKYSKEINLMTGKRKKTYLNAIYQWTNLDVRKLNTATQNNLNYLLIYWKDRPNLLQSIQDGPWTNNKK